MKKTLILSTLSLSLLMGASDFSEKYNYEVGLFGAGILKDNKLENNYPNLGVSIAKNLHNSYISQVELGFLRSESVAYDNNMGSTYINRLYLDLNKRFNFTKKFALYALAGLGHKNLVNEIKSNEDTLFFNYGVGLRYDIPYYGISVKGDVRHLIEKENKNDFMYTFGLAMPLGARVKEVIEPKVGEIEAIEPLAVDTTEKVAPAVNNDEDGDGVINSLDKCPGTSPGVKVNEDGCVETVKLSINFAYNSSKISGSYSKDLEKFASMLKGNKELTAVIEAHTDSIGSEKYNQKLSDKRAASAVKALKALDIDESRLKSIGYGETQPIASNKTKEGRAQNRRVIGYVNQ